MLRESQRITVDAYYNSCQLLIYPFILYSQKKN